MTPVRVNRGISTSRSIQNEFGARPTGIVVGQGSRRWGVFTSTKFLPVSPFQTLDESNDTSFVELECAYVLKNIEMSSAR